MKVIGHDDAGEPIWQFTSEEYQQRMQEFAAARERAKAQAGSAPPEPNHQPTLEQEKPPRTEEESSHAEAVAAQNPQAMELGSAIWEMRKRGLSVYEIHRRLGIPMEGVKESLEKFERSFYPDVGAAIAQRLALDD